MKPEKMNVEQKAKLESDKDNDEPMSRRLKVTDEMLDTVAGGTDKANPSDGDIFCPKCGSTNVYYHSYGEYIWCHCNNCGFEGYLY